MARGISVTLEWMGPFDDLAKTNGREGIYMVIAARRSGKKWSSSTYKLLDIWQAGERDSVLASSARKDSWEKALPEGNALLLKFALMPIDRYDEIDRQIVECCLRSHNAPLPCGTEDEGYNRRDVVWVVNEGQRRPLRESYTCGLPL